MSSLCRCGCAEDEGERWTGERGRGQLLPLARLSRFTYQLLRLCRSYSMHARGKSLVYLLLAVGQRPSRAETTRQNKRNTSTINSLSSTYPF